MRRFLLSFEYFMPLAIIGSSLFFLASLGFLLIEYGTEEHRLKGILAVLFSIAGLIILTFIVHKFVKRRRALKTLKNIHKLLEKQENAQAIEKLKTLISQGKLKDIASLLYFMLARAYRLSGKREEAKKAYRAAAGFWGAHNNLAVLLIEEGKYEEAIEQLRKAIALNPYEEMLYSQLAWTLQKIDEPVLARKVLENAMPFFKNTKALEENIKKIENNEEVAINSRSPAFFLSLLR